MESAAEYFEKRVPLAWNERLAAQAAKGAEGAELLAKMRATELALEVEVGAHGRYHLLVERARCAAPRTPIPW
jgi:hypothetical protein